MQHKPILFSSTLILLILISGFIGVVDSVSVILTKSSTSSNCTALNDTTYICGNLTLAMNISCENENLTIYFNDSQLYEISVNATFLISCPVSWIGRNRNDGILCMSNTWLSFKGNNNNNTNNSISFSFIQFTSCGAGMTRSGVTISNLNSIFFEQVLFEYTTVLLLNTFQVHISNCTFDQVNIMPVSALAVIYNTSLFDAVSVNVTNSRFTENKVNNRGICHECLPGIITFSVSEQEHCDIRLNIESCVFDQNQLNFDSRMISFDNVKNSNIEITIAHCNFTKNYYSWVIETFADGNNLQLVFLDNLFGDNNFLQDTLLSISTSSNQLIGNESLYFLYDRTRFINNRGTILTIKSLSDVPAIHKFNNCSFSTNTIFPNLINIDGQHTVKVIMNNMYLSNNTVQEVMDISNIKASNSYMVFLLNITLSVNNLTIEGYRRTFSLSTAVFTLKSVQATFVGKNFFTYNRGIYGGAMYIGSDTTITAAENSSFIFENNYAVYGGALYINSSDFNNDLSISGLCDERRLEFHNNRARMAGSNIYIADTENFSQHYQNCTSIYNNSILAPDKICINQANISLYSGKVIHLNVFVYDVLNNQSHCRAEINLACDTTSETPCEEEYPSIEFIGPPYTFLGLDEAVNTQLKYINRSNVSINIENPVLRVQCIEPYIQKAEQIKVILLDCPIGFFHDSKTKECKCYHVNNSDITCLIENGIICVKRNLWVRFINEKVQTITCPRSLCNSGLNNQTKYCINKNDMIALPQSEDDQCLNNRRGIRCSKCLNGYFTFGGVSCTNDCQPIYTILIIIFAVCIQLLIMVLILAGQRFKLEIGLGFLYGPLLFVAVVGHMHYDYYSQFSVLKTIINIFQSLLLMNLQMLGDIKWCFGYINELLFAFSFYYLGPILIWIFLGILVVIGRCCPRILYKIQKSPIQSFCLLMMLSFWSFASTSIQFLVPVKYGDDFHVNIDPEVKYFHDWHILFVLLAILFIVVIIIPFIGILFISNVTAIFRCFHLYRIKPILDEFQSCYRDKYRWYCVVYYISWIVYLLIDDDLIATEMLFVFLLSLLFLLEPYKYRIQNVIDKFLILDLILINFFLNLDENATIFKLILIHLMTLLPLLFIIVGYVVIVIRGIMKECRSNRKSLIEADKSFPEAYGSMNYNIAVTDVTINDEHETNKENEEREPLISFLQESSLSLSKLDVN
jgi:hypothetical protein